MFSSLPLYLDPPNWSNHEQQNHQEASSSISHGGGSNAHHLHTPAPAAAAAAAAGQARPGPMAERARLMKIPQPEAVLRCPRCDSSNTKFCYFNNYSLAQPRHFCKACRRYWTHGGALRNVPVGGGCRRNRRSKTSTSSSKSRPATATSAGNILPVAPPPFLPSSPWQPLQDYYTSSSASGIGFSGLPDSLGTEQWRIQPFQSLWGGSEPPSDTAAQEFSGMYPFQGHGVSSGLITQLANVKMEGVISINDPEQLWSATIASGQGGSSLFGGGSAGNGGGGGGGYMNINEVSGGFKSSSTAGLS